MKLPSLRGRGLRPSSLIGRARSRRNTARVSQSRIRRFLGDMRKQPLVALPEGSPASIAVVMPCYGHATYLPEALESLLTQTRPPDEVIFVDDHSPDETGEILRSFAAGRPWPGGVRVELLVNERNIGQSGSLNRGIAAAASDLIMILNDDDYLMHDAIESALDVLGRNPGVALMGATSVGFGERDSLANVPKISTAYGPAGPPLHVHLPEEVLLYRHPNDINMTHSSCCFYRAVWAAVGGYQVDKKRRVVPFSDRDLQIRVNAIWPVAVAETTPFAFWRNDSSVDRLVNS